MILGGQGRGGVDNKDALKFKTSIHRFIGTVQ